VAVSGAAVPIPPLALTGEATGSDLGLESLATLADGSPIANPRIFRVAEMALTRAQRRVSRRKRGSQRRRQAVAWLARAHQHVRRVRQDLQHQTALALVQQYDLMAHEDVQTANLVRHHHRAQSMVDAGWSPFLSILSFKAEEAGKTVLAVPAADTAHACAGCGVLVQKALSVRWHACPDCGTRLHRDQNAALHILRVGQRAGGQPVQALTWANGPSVA
jgi:putative transposase